MYICVNYLGFICINFKKNSMNIITTTAGCTEHSSNTCSTLVEHSVNGLRTLFKLNQETGNCFSHIHIMIFSKNNEWVPFASNWEIPGIVSLDYVMEREKLIKVMQSNEKTMIKYIETIFK